VQHFTHEGFHLQQSININMGQMVLITNPYSFFSRILPEIQARASKNGIPEGSFAIKFERQGDLHGGVIINNAKGNCSLKIFKTDQEFKNSIVHVPDRAEFQNVSKLTLIALGIIKPDDLDQEELTMKGNALKWFEGLFCNISSDLYEMDHF